MIDVSCDWLCSAERRSKKIIRNNYQIQGVLYARARVRFAEGRVMYSTNNNYAFFRSQIYGFCVVLYTNTVPIKHEQKNEIGLECTTCTHTHTCTADSKISLSWPMDDDDVVMSTLSNKGGWFGSPIFALHQPRRRRRRGGKSAINRKKLLQFDSFSLHKIRTQTHTDGRVNEEQQKNTDAITQQSVPHKKKTNSLFCCTHK